MNLIKSEDVPGYSADNTNQAQHAIRAAQNAHVWGLFEATRYAKSKGVHHHTFLLALRLESEKRLVEAIRRYTVVSGPYNLGESTVNLDPALPILLRKQAE